MVSTETLLETAAAAARTAGDLVRDMLDGPINARYKNPLDIVTDADMAAQKLITDSIKARFPDHGFLTEEEDPSLPTDGRVTWIIDPVDGTTNYSRRMPAFCVSIAAAINGQTQVAAVYDPMHDDLFTARRGHGAWRNGKRLTVNSVSLLSNALLALDWSRGKRQRQALLAMLGNVAPKVHTVRAIGSAALAICWIAAGHLDVYINIGLKAWDVAGAGLILQEAGGTVSGSDGAAFDLNRPKTWTLSTNGHLRDAILPYLTPLNAINS